MCRLASEMIFPMVTPMGKNEKRIISKVDENTAGSGAKVWPIKASAIKATLRKPDTLAIISRAFIYISFNDRTLSSLGPFSVCCKVQISLAASCSKNRWYPLSAASVKMRFLSSKVRMGLVSYPIT